MNRRIGSFNVKPSIPATLFILPLIVLTLAGPIISYYVIRNWVRFRDDWISGRYEGSLSENLGFMTALTTDLSDKLKVAGIRDDETTSLIENELMKMKVEIENATQNEEDSLLKEEEFASIASADIDQLLNMIHNESVLEILDKDHFGLIKCEGNDPRPCMESSSSVKAGESFVFIPAPLLTEGRAVDFSTILKKELLFSIVAEKYIVRAVANIKEKLSDKTTIDQAYFIPFSGFVRVMSFSGENPYERYHNRFPPLKSFSDRTYFLKTRAEPNKMRITEPYVDVAGGGLVKTYSIYINGPLGVSGMVGVDRTIKELADSWQQVSLGSAILKDFKVTLHSIDENAPAVTDVTREYLIDHARSEISRNPTWGLESIRRFTSNDSLRTVFTVPINSRSYACFAFDEQWTEIHNIKILCTHAVSIGAAIIIVFLLLRSARRQAEAEEIRTAIIKNLHAGIVVVNRNKIISMCNTQFCQMAKLKEDNIVKRNMLNFLARDSRRELEACMAYEAFEFPGRLKDNINQTKPVIISGATIRYRNRDDSKVLVIIPSEQLEITIGKRFLNVFSHALKTPTHSILMIADSLRRKRNEKKYDHLFSLLQKEMDGFKTLTDNVLSFAEINPQLHLKRENLAKLVRRAVSAGRARAQKLDISIATNIPETLNMDIDSGKLMVILNNLMDNAIKYTGDGVIDITVSDFQGHVDISFVDTGMGVPAADRNNIFERFFRVDNPNVRCQDGMGIVLFVSKKYAEIHNGDIIYKPNVIRLKGGDVIEKGSRFIVRLRKEQGGKSHG